jgi:hypothetical protein
MINYLKLIDWQMLAFTGLWIIGLAVVVAIFGFVQFAAQRTARRFGNVLQESGYQAVMNAGLTIICLGLIGSSRHWWEVVVWSALAILFCVNMILALRADKPK